MGRFWSRHRTVFAVALVTALAAGGAGGIAMAVIPDTGSGVFHGCYSKITGALRLIDPSKGQNCKSTEKAISWDQSAVVWRGNWKASVSYSSHDAVAYQGSSYVATVANAGQSPPTHPGDWLVLAQAGPKGAVGQAGPPGSPGRGGLLPGELTLGVGVPVILNSADYGFSNVVAIASDGSHVWVVNTSGDSVTEIDAQDGSLVQLLSGGRYAFNQPTAIAFDGSHLWITNGGGNSVTEMNACRRLLDPDPTRRKLRIQRTRRHFLRRQPPMDHQ